MRDFFPDGFYTARDRLRASLAQVRGYYPAAQLERYPLPYAPELAIEWITAVPPHPRRLLILTTGLHGVEGHVGAAIIQLFLADFLPRLDAHTSGLLLVHPLNTWGMQQRRRVNGRNVDLNRNFFLPGDPEAYSPAINPAYDGLVDFLNPARPARSMTAADGLFAAGVGRMLATAGVEGVRAGTLLGQYRYPRGVYYGGTAPEPEATWLAETLRAQLARYAQILLIDVHTGYGPRTQMTLVNSTRQEATAVELARRFDYPLVVKAVPGEFYAIRGDMVDFAYQLAAAEFPSRRLYATAFEFGTLGDSTWAGLRSLQALVLENQEYWYGSTPRAYATVKRRFDALFDPAESSWRAKALADARQAFAGILHAEGFIPGGSTHDTH